MLHITTEGTTPTADGIYNLLSIDQVEYAFGLGTTPAVLTGWGDTFGAAPPPFDQVLTGQVEVTGGVASIFQEFRASDPAGANVARSGVAGSGNARVNGSSNDYDFLPTSITLSPSAVFTSVVNAPPTVIANLTNFDSNTQINVFDGGQVGVGVRIGLDADTSTNVELNVSGGTIDDALTLNAGSNATITGGDFGEGFWVRNFASADISGGTFGTGFRVFGNGTLTVTDGAFDDDFDTYFESKVDIEGGTFGDIQFFGGDVDVSGGEFNGIIEVYISDPGESLNLIGTSFSIDGTPITGLTPNVPFVISDRDVTLDAVLADGSAFDLDLNTTFTGTDDLIGFGAVITVTLVPEPNSLALLGLGGLLLARRRRRLDR